jgi:hypothetical protein
MLLQTESITMTKQLSHNFSGIRDTHNKSLIHLLDEVEYIPNSQAIEAF